MNFIGIVNQFSLIGVSRAGDAHGMSACIAAALVTIACLAPWSSVATAEKSMQELSLEIEAATNKARNGHSKISHLLEKKISKIKVQRKKIPPQNTAARVDMSALSSPFVKINKHGHIQVYIHVVRWSSAERAALEKLRVDIEIINTEFRIVQAWVPHGLIKKIARLDFVSRITPPAYGETQAGSVQTEGDTILGGDDVRALGFDGSGVNIGVISFGVVGLTTAQSSGDLPFVDVLQTATDHAEGTAMLEVVHDIAPGATLGFCGMPTRTSLEFIQCVNLLNTTFNADIIVDDIGFFDEPYFEDGIIAQTVKSAVDAGIFYTSAAGNDAERHYQDDFLADGSGSGFHDFGTRSGGAADIDVDFSIPPGQTLALALQWSEPFGGACSDYNLVLYDQFMNILDISLRPQSCAEDPIESVWYTNPSMFTSMPASIVVVKDSGSDATLEMFYRLEPAEYNMPEDSIFGHPAVRGVMAVGAIAYSDPGNDDINTYSSRGPATIVFPASDVREKPDITAIDGVSVTGAGGFGTPFSGTSAAAPHVAAIAALLMSADPSATAADISDVIKNSAVDLGIAGLDFTYGYGRIDALAAYLELSCVGSGTDSDGDGIDDNCDNCTAVSNGLQQDADADGHGDICDADYDNTCVVDVDDLQIFKSAFFGFDPEVDMNSDGIVDVADLQLFKLSFFGTPGPSPAGSLCSP